MLFGFQSLGFLPQNLLSKYCMYKLSTGGVIYNLCDSKHTIEFSGIPLAVILTKIDEICSDVSHDLSTVFSSRAVKDRVVNVAEKLGIPQNGVLPVSFGLNLPGMVS